MGKQFLAFYMFYWDQSKTPFQETFDTKAICPLHTLDVIPEP